MSEPEVVVNPETITVEPIDRPPTAEITEVPTDRPPTVEVTEVPSAGPWGVPKAEPTVASQPADTPWGRVAPPIVSGPAHVPPAGASIPAPGCGSIPAQKSGLSTGAIIAIVAGVVIVLLACCCLTGFIITMIIASTENAASGQPGIHNFEDMFNELEYGFGEGQYYLNGVPQGF